MDKMLFDKIFDIVKRVMIANNLILKEGSIVDATLIHSIEPKRKKDTDINIISNKAADSAYMSKEKKRAFRDKGFFSGIIERRVREQKRLRVKQQKHNKN